MFFKISNKLIGFDKEIDFFLKLYRQKSLPNCIMLQGLDGIGKFTFALHLVNLLLNKKNKINCLEKDVNVKILNKNDNIKEYKIEEIKKIIDFCKLKSFISRFIVIKNINFLNNYSINALLKLTENPNNNIYFIFTSNLIGTSSDTLNSRFFKKKLFLKKKFYKDIIDHSIKNNNIENYKFISNVDNDTPGDHLRKFVFNIKKDIEKLKKNDENLFYKILCEKLIKNNELNIKKLKKIKNNLNLNNDFKKLYNKYF
tara:strand:+ start:3191 stop:3958 length:768 start_codon:yes stop_codon:yes gene_type:complete